MQYLAALTLPALAVLLVVASAVETFAVRRRRRRGETAARSYVAGAGFDVLGTALAPSTGYRLEHDESERLRRDDDAAGAPPRSRVDLETRVARLVLPPTPAVASSPAAARHRSRTH